MMAVSFAFADSNQRQPATITQLNAAHALPPVETRIQLQPDGKPVKSARVPLYPRPPRRTWGPTRVMMDATWEGKLSFRQISYVLDDSLAKTALKSLLPCFFEFEPPKRPIVGVSGLFKPGMNAIMGPTGCGKTSLLDVLAYRKSARGVSGTILIDGKPPPPSYKYIIGYVVQEDIICGSLTVRENLMFSANLRLPSDIKKEQREQRVEKVINELSIRHCADTKVGTEFVRGVSGGEKKRTCIGMELVLNPKILFLDEPTTGLDSATAVSVMTCLKRLSKARQCNIIFSIHQPRFSIFQLFDNVLFMCKGRCVFNGPPRLVVPHLRRLGYVCPDRDNPADFALDVLIDVSAQPEELRKLHQAYLQSPMHRHMMAQLPPISIDEDSMKASLRRRGAPGRPLWTEIYFVSRRTLKMALTNPALFLSQMVVALVLGLLVGLVFFNLERTIDPGVQNRLGAIFFIVISQVFSTVTALEPFIKERALFIHERASGYYRTTSFFIAKLLCDVLPMRIPPAVVFSLLAYFMIGLQSSPARYFIFLATIFMASLFGSALCFLAAASISMFSVALIIVVLIFVIMLVFSGFLISLSSVFSWLSWIQWISAFRYASNVLTINEFRNSRFCVANLTNVCPMTGEDVLRKEELDFETSWDLWKYFLALSTMSITIFLMAYVQLIRVRGKK